MHRTHVLLGYVALVVAPVVIWWLLPDMSAEGETDHIVEPPDIPDAMRFAMGSWHPRCSSWAAPSCSPRPDAASDVPLTRRR